MYVRSMTGSLIGARVAGLCPSASISDVDALGSCYQMI